jgi:hypothetical protein
VSLGWDLCGLKRIKISSNVFSVKVVFLLDHVRILVAVFFVGFPSMEMTLSAISDLRPFVRR